jgi:rhamnulokinase
VRCLLDSLVTKTALGLDQLAVAADTSPERIVLGGGGVRNELFCRLLADATGRPVETGPVEATAVGNLLTQAVGVGTVSSIESGRELVRASLGGNTYEPGDGWPRATERLRGLIGP